MSLGIIIEFLRGLREFLGYVIRVVLIFVIFCCLRVFYK